MLALALSAALSGDYSGIEIYRPYDALGYALVVAAIAPLAWRSRLPVTVAWVTWAVWTVSVGLNYPDLFLSISMFIAYYGLGAYTSRRVAFVNGGVMMVLLMTWSTVGMFVYDYVTFSAVVSAALIVIVPVSFGRVEQRRRQRLSALELEAARRELAAHDAAHDAVRAERARIARELHDVVAHEITVMTLQAEGARMRAANTHPEMAQTFATISGSGRRGLDEMQRMIGVLRTSEAEAIQRADSERSLATGESPHVRSTLPDLTPMPSLASLPMLVEKVVEAGLPVDLEISGSSHVPAGVELSAYRIVQESLTNALKYAGPGAQATVTVQRTPQAVTIDVEDDGRGVIREAAQVSGGQGLAGMQERVAVLGGTIDFGPRKGGGFAVHAMLPVTDDQVGSAARRAATVGDTP